MYTIKIDTNPIPEILSACWTSVNARILELNSLGLRYAVAYRGATVQVPWHLHVDFARCRMLDAMDA